MRLGAWSLHGRARARATEAADGSDFKRTGMFASAFAHGDISPQGQLRHAFLWQLAIILLVPRRQCSPGKNILKPSALPLLALLAGVPEIRRRTCSSLALAPSTTSAPTLP